MNTCNVYAHAISAYDLCVVQNEQEREEEGERER